MKEAIKTIHFKGKDIRYACYFHDKGEHMELKGQPLPGNTLKVRLTLMLIHGFPESGDIFKAQIAALSTLYNLIVPDLPGSGASPYNPALQTTADFADSIQAIIIEEKIEKLVVIGHSMGGYIALAFGEKYPERLLGLGLLHSTAYQDNEAKKQNRLKAIETMQHYGGASFLRAMIPALFSANYKEKHAQVVQDLINTGSHFETRALQQYYQMMHDRIDKTDLFSKLTIPYLLISGTEDKAAPAGDLIQQATLIDTVMVEILSDAGHMGFIEKPEEVSKIIHQFMQLVQTLQVSEAL